jgi:hypothetical protein
LEVHGEFVLLALVVIFNLVVDLNVAISIGAVLPFEYRSIVFQKRLAVASMGEKPGGRLTLHVGLELVAVHKSARVERTRFLFDCKVLA